MQEMVEKTIGIHGSNTRLDAFLADVLKRNAPTPTSYSRSQVRRDIEQGSVRVNEVVETNPGRRLKYGDRVRATLQSKEFSIRSNAELMVPILFEDEHIIVIDKPVGMQVHPGSAEANDTVANWALAHCPAIALVGEDPLRPGIVHRLDRNTSGVLVLAKTAEAFAELKQRFQSRQVRKTYVALVMGNINPVSGVVSWPIAHRTGTLKRIAVEHPETFPGDMKGAVTEYRLEERFFEHDLLFVFPKTGRTHQIRVHLASIGHPVVGDHLYGGRRMRDSGIPSRQLLHASELEFELFGKVRRFSSPLPEDFRVFLGSINSRSDPGSVSDVSDTKKPS